MTILNGRKLRHRKVKWSVPRSGSERREKKDSSSGHLALEHTHLSFKFNVFINLVADLKIHGY